MNADPNAKWNKVEEKDNPFRPWNDPAHKHDPFAPWNLLGNWNEEDYIKYCKENHIPERNR